MVIAPEGFKEVKFQSIKELRRIRDGRVSNLKFLSDSLGEKIEYNSKVLFLAYFPERGDIFLTSDLEVKENPDRHTGVYNENIIFRRYIYKHDTRDSSVFPTVEDYENAEKEGSLEIGKFEMYRVLDRKAQYFVHIKE